MTDAEAFDLACAEIEARTTLDRLASRGTVRIALRQAGLDARTVTPEQMAVVMEKRLPEELTSRNVAGAAALCTEIAQKLRRMPAAAALETPDAVFRRLGG